MHFKGRQNGEAQFLFIGVFQSLIRCIFLCGQSFKEIFIRHFLKRVDHFAIFPDLFKVRHQTIFWCAELWPPAGGRRRWHFGHFIRQTIVPHIIFRLSLAVQRHTYATWVMTCSSNNNNRCYARSISTKINKLRAANMTCLQWPL